MRMWRKGLHARTRPAYVLNVDLFRKLLRRRSIYVVADLAGLNYDTLGSWLYVRGVRHKGRATRENAQKLADFLGAEFERLWRRA